ncbi:hypothetical protein FHX82_006408 [Amycolatopsis bartoniae]|uniref:Uncharacterized protein n=1 Tax=Amycolatopsis bartoniae TaxID=941986 RepID=A0A8H9IN43_9PSEU|nr:hypothetical protein [Amycolatopsis bartoniae]MBB2939322.1 hypothetical protein [Amycolatopsis bartoniae]TVT08772.1 hypothetical protein FNH07_11675 [Amycolatopsis bartoniae]GHF37320.1 hypothetical protein GCM10017566_08090 [Amycolatopsis bartoniae]
MPHRPPPATAGSSTWTDEDGVRQPRGDVHAWVPGTNQTLCGVPLHRARLARFPHVLWVDALWLADTRDEGISPCRRCTAAAGGRGGARRWTRVNPRP